MTTKHSHRWGATWGLALVATLLLSVTALAQGIDTVVVVDDFERTDLGPNWAAGPEYIIASGELQNTAGDGTWNHLAVYKGDTGFTEEAIVWGSTVTGDDNGSGAGGVVLLIDAATDTANGYLIFKRSTGLFLYTVVKGAPDTKIAQIDNPLITTLPAAGDTFRVSFSNESDGYHFDCYVNGQYDGTLVDASKTMAIPSTMYAGVMLYGLTEGNNNVEQVEFVRYDDNWPPEAITDLTSTGVTRSSVSLQWTAPHQNGNTDGAVDHYEIRYSTSQITESNWSSATLDNNSTSIVPADPGNLETYSVSGLNAGTTYYFAIKSFDAAGNASDISNVISATTQEAPQTKSYTDNFNRSTLGTGWAADPEYAIQNNELANTGSTGGWTQMAVWKEYRDPVAVSYRWGAGADDGGINAGGFAVMLDAADPNANGYMVLRRQGTLRLYEIVNGEVVTPEIDEVTCQVEQNPVAGDQVRLEIYSDDTGHHFTHYVRGVVDGTVTDPNKLHGNEQHVYAGVMLYPGLNNNIDDFTEEIQVGSPSVIEIYSGDQQSGTVNTTLPNPLVVKVTDEYGNPSANVFVDFAVTQGVGYLSTDTVTTDGNYWKEAEDGTLNGPTEIRWDDTTADGDGTASDSQYVTTTVHSQGYVDFSFYITEPEVYKFWFRSAAPDGGSNSIYGIQVDDNPDTLRPGGTYWSFSAGSDYDWYSSSECQFYLAHGVHHIKVLFREPDWKLDKVLLTKNLGYTPSGKGGTTPPLQNYTDENGLASTRLTFGTVSGEVHVTATAENVGSVVFVEHAQADAPSTMVKTKGDGQSGAAGQPLADSLEVLVRDQYENPVPNVPVTFTVVQGGGSVKPTTVNTDVYGKARTQWTLGSDSTYQEVHATSSQLPGDTEVFTATATSGIPAKLTYLDGDNQTGTVGEALAKPLQVKILDNSGNPAANQPVTFTVKAGGGTLDDGVTEKTVNTNSQGIAQVTLTLGTVAGTDNNVVEAASYRKGQHLEGSPYTFKESAQAGQADTLKYISGNNQQGPVGLPLNEPFVVEVRDIYGNPKPNHPVLFEVIQGNGNIDGSSQKTVNTDENGRAQVTYTMGSTPGVVNKVRASSTPDGPALNGSPIIFEATATEGVASELVYVSGDSQTAKVGTTLPQPFRVKVTDVFGNPIENYTVQFEVKSGGGNFNGQTKISVSTNAQGIAEATLTLGTTAGTNSQVVWATATRDGTPLNGSPYEFKATATPDEPARLVEVSGNNQTGPVGLPLNQPFIAKVVDQYGNGISGQTVHFKVTAGGGNINGKTEVDVTTDGNGLAQVTLTLGTTPGTNNNKVEASASYNGNPLTGSPIIFQASATAGEAAKLLEVSGNGQTGTVGKPLTAPFVVKVTDQYDNPVSGYQVHFAVVAGGGNIGGATETDVATGTDGTASVTLTLGTQVGIDNNAVDASAANLSGSPVHFKASAVADVPQALSQVSGNNQSGEVGTTLPQAFVVKVTDQYGNPVSGHPVTFEVISGGGNFGGQSSITVNTSDDGTASAVYTLGPEPGTDNNVVEARSLYNGNPLAGSPVTFTASATPGHPTKLEYVSGNDQTGIINSPLEQPFRVKVTDSFGNGIPNHPVTFTVTAGGGHLDGTSQTTVTKQTNSSGLAEVRLTLGPTTGNKNNVVEARSSYDGVELDGSPVIFRASAKANNAAKLLYVEGNNQRGTVGEPLPMAFKVRVTDQYDNPVEGHPVTFKVTAGGGTLNGDADTLVVVNTNNEGYAQATLTLGHKAGTNNNVVEASATNGVGPLEGSPVTFTASAAAALPDPDSCRVTADPTTAPADGETVVNLSVTLVDRYGNPTPNKVVIFQASGDGSEINQPLAPTDANGQASATMTSTRAGEKIITVRDVTDQLNLNCQASVTFTPLEASRIVLDSGNNQTRNIGTILADSLVVMVTDKFGNPIEGFPVNFVPTAGNGKVVENMPVLTNAQGLAWCHYILGTTPGTDLVEARAADLEGSPVIFRLNAVQGRATTIEMVSGDGQTGIAGHWAHDPMVVYVADANGDPVWGVEVTFSAPMGGEVYPVVDTTDAWGHAQTFLKLGKNAGTYTAVAQAETLTQVVTFAAEAVSGEAARVIIASGDNQTGTVAHTLPQPIVVKVTDPYGNGVPDIPVTFEVIDGGGSVAASGPVPTDANGFARTTWTLGIHSGDQKTRAIAEGLEGSPVIFTAHAKPSTPDSIGVFSGNNQKGQVGQQLGLPIEAIVLDRFGNGVPNVAVTFSAVDGMSRIVETTPVTTDERGVASAHWILGSQPGDNIAWAIRLNLKGSPVVFHATGESNQYPQIVAPSDTTIRENQHVEFVVLATDPDGGNVRMGARGIPQGATFDSLGSHIFAWTPNYRQGGIYRIRFYARDDEGGVSYHIVTINVINQNRPPEIASYHPTELVLSATYPDTILFDVSAADPDQDSLRYEWLTITPEETHVVSSLPTYKFVSTRYDPGNITVRALIFDQDDTVHVDWLLTVLTSVQLESFEAQMVPFKGVRLQWKTTREQGNLGFNILRSATEDGEYVRVNTKLIPPNENHEYQFVDLAAKAGKVYYYKLEDVSVSGFKTQHDPVRVSVPIPKKFAVYQNFPNPFNPTTTIRFELPKPEHVRIEIYNVLGQKIRTLLDKPVEAGYHAIQWDSRNDNGVPVSSGIYYYRITAGQHVAVKKMALLK